MAKKNQIGAILAVIALLAVLLLGIVEASGIISVSSFNTWIVLAIIAVGAVLGFLNVKDGESLPFMVAALVIASALTGLAALPFVGDWLQVIFGRLALLIWPAALVVAGMVFWKKIKN